MHMTHMTRSDYYHAMAVGVANALAKSPTSKAWLIDLLYDALAALEHEPAFRHQFTAAQAISRSAAREDLRRALEALEA